MIAVRRSCCLTAKPSRRFVWTSPGTIMARKRRLIHHVIPSKRRTTVESRELSTTSPNPPSSSATVIQGPSLLANTGASRPSPSLFHLPGLRSLPFWTAPSSTATRNRIAYNDPIVSTVVEIVESNYKAIREEYMSAVLGMGSQIDLDSDRVSQPLEPDYDVNTRGGEHAADALHEGTWDWHSYVLSGERQPNFAARCPRTAAMIDDLDQRGLLFKGTPFGFVFYSTLQGSSRIKAHTGPMNLRLRVHLPLLVPDAGKYAKTAEGFPPCGMRVGDQIRQWEEGNALVLDDSYEHEVWNETEEPRVLLLLDVWHPDVREEERERVGNMFEYAKGQGWIGKEKSE